MTNKFLIGIALAFFSVFILGVGAVVGISRMTEQTAVSPPLTTTGPEGSTGAGPSQPPEVQSLEQPAPPVSPSPITAAAPPSSLQAIPIPVLNSDLDRLAAAVKLGEANTGDVSKETWARQVPVAEKLLQGLCDCDQRNWLKHFVKTGNDALSGSEDYYQSIQLLAKLRRYDQDLTANQTASQH
jgi:hypothetical protein